jgi:SAM-dependent methyltransferase
MASYDPSLFTKLWQIEDRHFWFKARNQVIISILRRLVEHLPEGYRVLEVGCGTGNVLRYLEQVCTGGQVIGLDLFFEGLRFAQQRVSCQLVQADINRPPFGQSFDVIGIFDVLEHLDNDQDVLRTLHKLLKPGGYLLITVPAHRALWSYFDESAHHCRRYQKGELARKLVESNFEVIFLTHYMASIFPLVWLGRRLAARRHASNDALTANELKIVPFANGILSALLHLEARLVSMQVPLPIGTSLLAVARKRST